MNHFSLALGLATLLFIGSAYSQYDSRGGEEETDGQADQSEYKNVHGLFEHGQAGQQGDIELTGDKNGHANGIGGHRHGGGRGGSRMHGHRHRHRGGRDGSGGNMGADIENEGQAGSIGDTEVNFGGSDGHTKGIGSHRHGGRGGMGSGRGGMGSGRGGMGSGRGGRGGGRGGRGGGRGGMGGGRGGMGGGRGGMGGGRGGGRGGRRGSKSDRRSNRKERIKEKQEQSKIINLVKGMTNFTSGDYQSDSTMMTLYLRASDKVGSLLAKRQEILMNKLRIANVNGKTRVQVTNGAYRRTEKITHRWNSKCQKKFAEWVKKFGENPTGKGLKTAKAKIDLIAAHYVQAVKKLFDHLSETLDENDKGYYLDEVKQENGNPKKMRALMRDVKKIAANLGCAIQVKKTDMEPHHDKNHMPSAADTYLIKRLGSARVHALDAFTDYQKKILAESRPKDRSQPVDLEILKKSLKLLEAKKDELLEKAIAEMKDTIEKEKVAPEHMPLKEKLSEVAQDIFNQEKTSRMPQLKAIMMDLAKRVEKKPGGKLIEKMLRQQSQKEMAKMQDAVGDAVSEAVQRLGNSGGSLDEQVKNGTSSVKFTIMEVMDKAQESLKQFLETKIKDLETGKGIFGHINQLGQRKKE